MLFVNHLTHPAIEQLFSDGATVSRWVEVEIALAKAQAQVGVIGVDSAEIIASKLTNFQPDQIALKTALDKSGVPIAALVKQLRSTVGSPHGNAIHYGATTQDIIDTALVLQLRDALNLTISPLLSALMRKLAQLADRHRKTVMAGRTNAQQAVPTTFGLKVANWLAPLLRHRQRLDQCVARLFVVQFGGAAGTLSALGADGVAVQQALADELELGQPVGVWHTQRDLLAEFATVLTMITGALAKIAEDVMLLAQSEVASLRESVDLLRGGSSTMPQKQNPVVSHALTAIHRANSDQVASLLHALPHAHERDIGAWQTEWMLLPQIVSRTAAALEKAVWLSQNMVVDAVQMRRNLDGSNGMLLAEAASFALAETMPRDEAKQLVRDAAQSAQAQGRHLIDVLAERTATVDWDRLRDEENYLGSAEILIDKILAGAERIIR